MTAEFSVAEISDEEIIALRKSTSCNDYRKPWADTLAFARAVIALEKAKAAESLLK